MTSKIFISYSRKDLDLARRIVSMVSEKIGIIPWMDLTGIESGKQFLEVIVSAIDACDVFLCLLSRNSLESSYVRKELTYAVHTGKTIFPLEMEKIEIPDWLWALYDGKYYLLREDEKFIEDIRNHLNRLASYVFPDSVDGHECVDLGLSVGWATCNLGASFPYLSGDRFAWGETTPRSGPFDKESYSFYGAFQYGKYNTEDNFVQLEASDDAARYAWGGRWRMPTRREIEELLDKCVFTYVDGPLDAFGGQRVRGCVVTSRINRNSIYLPISGLQARWSNGMEPSEEDLASGLIWSSTLMRNSSGTVHDESRVNILKYNSLDCRIENDDLLCLRSNGLCIRPVADLALHAAVPHKLFSECSKKICNDKDIFVNSLWSDDDALYNVVRMIDREADLKAGYSWVDDKYEDKEKTIAALRRCRIAVFILSRASVKSDEMRKRVHYAQERGKTIIPIWTAFEEPSGWILFELEPSGIIRYHQPSQMSHLASQFKTMSELKDPTLVHPDLHRSPVRPFSEGLAAFYEHSRWGFRDKSGGVVIPPKLTVVSDFKDGLAIAAKGQDYGFIDSSGKFVLRCNQYERMGTFSDGLAMVVYKEKHGFIDRTGKMVIPAVWDLSGSFSEGLAMVMKDQKWGFVNRKGALAIPLRYHEAEDFSEGLAAVMDENDLWGFIDTLGRTVIEHRFRSASSFQEGKAYVLDEDGAQFIDRTGKRCFETPLAFYSSRDSYYCDGRALVTDEEDERWYIDEQGVFIDNPLMCEGYGSFSEGLAIVIRNNKAGYIDRNGNLVIDCIYDGAGSFHEGYAAVHISHRYFYIDKNGKRMNGF